jgi:alkylhydroperoxidase family enzyme
VAWIRTVSDEEATGLLRKEYDAAIQRAGKVFNIVRMFSLNPRALRDTLGLYRTVMHGPSDLSRAEREMIATVVSKENACHY